MGESLSLQQALQRMNDLDELDRTAIWPGGKIPQWVLDDMAANGVQQTSVAPVLWALHSWPQIARTLRAEVERLQPQVENWHVYLRWRGKQDETEAERDALDQAAPEEVER